MVLFLDENVGKLKTWQLYVGFVILQLLIGIIFAIVLGIFDLTGIRGALGETVRQVGMLLNGQPPQAYIRPITAEVKAGKLI
jgi:hypothetical protein